METWFLLLSRKKLQHLTFTPFRDADFDAKPQVLLLGQYSVGKTSFIRYILVNIKHGRNLLLKGERVSWRTHWPRADYRSFLGSYARPIGSHYSWQCFGCSGPSTPSISYPQADKPFRGLSQFGTGFLSKFECSQCPCPILESVTFIDTPGVLSGEKQRIGRSYDFVKVVQARIFSSRSSHMPIFLTRTQSPYSC